MYYNPVDMQEIIKVVDETHHATASAYAQPAPARAGRSCGRGAAPVRRLGRQGTGGAPPDRHRCQSAETGSGQHHPRPANVVTRLPVAVARSLTTRWKARIRHQLSIRAITNGLAGLMGQGLDDPILLLLMRDDGELVLSTQSGNTRKIPQSPKSGAKRPATF